MDASFLLLSFLREEISEQADRLLGQWRAAGISLVAPPMVMMEVPSVLRQAVHRGRISVDRADAAFETFDALDLSVLEPPGLLRRAWEMGKDLNAPRLYDMFYVALADLEGCELWTADRRLANLAQPRFPHVRWLGET
ncbi:MAG: type II toxin-antitoxin system VapC family toxin [Dehalococcoidia bacterium]